MKTKKSVKVAANAAIVAALIAAVAELLSAVDDNKLELNNEMASMA